MQGISPIPCFDKDYLIVLQKNIYLYIYLFYIILHIIYLKYKNTHTYHHTWLHDQQQKVTQKTQAIPKRAFFEAMFGSVGRRLTPQVPVGMGFEWSSRGFLKVDRFMKWPLGTAILSKYMGKMHIKLGDISCILDRIESKKPGVDFFIMTGLNIRIVSADEFVNS